MIAEIKKQQWSPKLAALNLQLFTSLLNDIFCVPYMPCALYASRTFVSCFVLLIKVSLRFSQLTMFFTQSAFYYCFHLTYMSLATDIMQQTLQKSECLLKCKHIKIPLKHIPLKLKHTKNSYVGVVAVEECSNFSENAHQSLQLRWMPKVNNFTDKRTSTLMLSCKFVNILSRDRSF